MNLSLAGKYAIVCGSAQGIGLAIAEELALLGAHCTLLSRNREALEAAVAKLDTNAGQRHGLLVADFTRPEEVKTVIEMHVKEYPVHILINNTGGPAPGPANTATEKSFIGAFNQHLICNHILAQAVIPSMQKDKYGRIINIISTSVKVPIKNLGVSNTIRGAVASWAKTLSNELAAFNITVNNILPGSTRTQRLDKLVMSIATGRKISPAEVEAEMVNEIPAKRFGEASEIAAMAAFLASPAASYVNGTSIRVDGGRTGSI